MIKPIFDFISNDERKSSEIENVIVYLPVWTGRNGASVNWQKSSSGTSSTLDKKCTYIEEKFWEKKKKKFIAHGWSGSPDW